MGVHTVNQEDNILGSESTLGYPYLQKLSIGVKLLVHIWNPEPGSRRCVKRTPDSHCKASFPQTLNLKSGTFNSTQTQNPKTGRLRTPHPHISPRARSCLSFWCPSDPLRKAVMPLWSLGFFAAVARLHFSSQGSKVQR